MRFGRLPAGLAGFFIGLSASAALACSTVALGLPERPIVAYSFDYAPTGAGHVFVNPAGATRRSIMDGKPAQWTVRYGSVTFNQLGPGMPVGGMNTGGLVVTLMWNDDAAYGGSGAAPIVNELEFIQRLLDTSGSVAEALASAEEVAIRGIVPIHFFLADRSGATAAITPTSGGLSLHSGADMPIPALTNTSYAELIGHIEGVGHDLPNGGLEAPNSLERFMIAAKASQEARSALSTDAAFAVLGEVANPSTRWQVVFNPRAREIAFQTVLGPDVHRIDMTGTDYRCGAHPRGVDLRAMSDGSLAPIDPARIAATSREVLASLPAEAGVGPEVAEGLTAGLLASLVCAPE